MVTPIELVGKTNPFTGKPFGKEITIGLGTRPLPEAMKQRDIVLGDIRRLAARARGEQSFELADALEWREMISHAKDEGGS